ncbi:MAG: cytochrome c oxidase subunit II [Natronomonas sp.]
MRFGRILPVALAGFLTILAIEPAAAQSTVNKEMITDLNLTLLYAAIPIAILVESVLIYAVIKFRNNDDPKPTEENRRLEITWTLATAVVLLFVGVASYQVLAVEAVGTPLDTNDRVEPSVSQDLEGAVGPYEHEENAVEIEIEAFRYGWSVSYADGEVSTFNEIRIPTDRPVYLHIYSSDWLHMLSVPELGLKQSAIVGEYNTIKTEADEPGSVQFYCTEYCGVGHSQMNGEFIVMEDEAFDEWLAEQQG